MRRRKYNRQSSGIRHLMGLLHTREWRNLADAPDLGSGGETLGGSSPPSRTSRSRTGLAESLRRSNLIRELAATTATMNIFRTWGHAAVGRCEAESPSALNPGAFHRTSSPCAARFQFSCYWRFGAEKRQERNNEKIFDHRCDIGVLGNLFSVSWLRSVLRQLLLLSAVLSTQSPAVVLQPVRVLRAGR